MFKLLKDQNGTITILMALIFTMLCGFIGLAIDVGKIFYSNQMLQNAVDITALAAVQEVIDNPGNVESIAEEFAIKNGLTNSEITITYPYSGDNNKVEISATRKVNLSILKVLGYSKNYVSVRAVAMYNPQTVFGYTDEALNYAVFSGSTSLVLQFAGTGSMITGNVHGNNDVKLQGVGHTVDGNVSAVGTISSINDTITGTRTEGVSVIPIPVFDFDYYADHRDQVFYGDLTLNTDVTIDGIWLVNGNVHISGARVSGKGILLATGEIQISGSLEYNPSDTDAVLAMYSQTDIIISGVNVNISGVLYAPNGKIRIDGSGNNFYGALIANQVLWGGADIVIDGSYDIRIPQAYEIIKPAFSLIE